MLSFILPTILKQDLEEVCVLADRNQSQVLREAVSTYVRFAKQPRVWKRSEKPRPGGKAS